MEGISNRSSDVDHQENLNAEDPMLMSSSPNDQRGPASIDENEVLDDHGDQGQRVGGGNYIDPKKLKRVAASRKYSQKYRLKQQKHILDLETEVRALQAEMEINFPRIKYADSHNALLRAENGSMRQKLSILTREIMLKEAEYHELKKEKDALKQMSLMYNQAPLTGDISQTSNNYNYQQVNVAAAMDQQAAGFNQLNNAAAEPMMLRRNLIGSHFGFDLNNEDNPKPMM